MDEPRRTQKQIAQQYQGNLAYYRRIHLWRFARILSSATAIIGGVVAIFYYQRQGPESFFTPGPLSPAPPSFGNGRCKCPDARPTAGGSPPPPPVRGGHRDR